MFLGNLILNYNLAILNNQIVLVLAKNCEKIFRYTVLPLIANENSCSLFVKSALTGALYSFSLIFSSNLRRSVRGQSFKKCFSMSKVRMLHFGQTLSKLQRSKSANINCRLPSASGKRPIVEKIFKNVLVLFKCIACVQRR